MAGKQGRALVAVVIGTRWMSCEAASEHGADKVIVVDGPEYASYTTDAYAIALCALVEKYGPTACSSAPPTTS
jgi:electron transfer flavoprotein alpha subunit